MKNQSFIRRLKFAVNGVKIAWRTEASFRVQILMGTGAIAGLFFLRPPVVWWALIFMVAAGVLSAELFNTALERLSDRLHPKVHPMITQAKDCAAGAVLVLGLASVVVFAAMLMELFHSPGNG